MMLYVCLSNPKPRCGSTSARSLLLVGGRRVGFDREAAQLKRQCQDKARSTSGLTLDPQLAAVRFDDGPGKIQTKPRALRLPAQRVIYAVEALEDPLLILGSDAHALIRHIHD